MGDIAIADLRWERIAIVGCPGSGKTTFACRLAERTGLPLYHLDDLYWNEGWVRPAQGEWEATVDALTAQSRWIIDGHHAPSILPRLRRAEMVVVLDVPWYRCAGRILRRTVRIKLGDRRSLPRRIRGEADPVAANHLTSLLWKVVRFRHVEGRDLQVLLRFLPTSTVVITLRGPSRRDDPCSVLATTGQGRR